MSATNADRHDEILYSTIFPFVLVHLACVAVIWSGVTWQAAVLGFTLYWLRMFGIGAGYHRYFSHRAYSTGRVFQFILACLAQSSAQKSVLWWAEKHRHHHLYSDLPQDVHSPRQKGFLYSHVGWIFARGHDGTDLAKIKDFARYPELMWLHRLEQLPAVILAGLCFLIAGWPGLVVGFFCSTVLVYHTTFCINSLAHVCGSKRYLTGDDSRNNWLLALMTMGEGWHNNHHAYQSSVRQGFRWWEVDATFYILKLLSWLGIVWNLKSPPQEVLRNEQRLGVRVINRAAAELAAQFNAQRIALAISTTLQGPELSQLREALQRAHDRAAGVLSTLHLPALPQLPSRDEFLAAAKARFARTISLDEIVDRAYELLLASIGTHLATVEQRS
ncbi:MAG TPA: acyl-CoA desaturase [Dongiaceae bacterium]|nr:acyl-CoA desaturase [Dongiaceae bacterium]